MIRALTGRVGLDLHAIGANLLPAVHDLAQIGPVPVKQIMTEDDLTQPGGVYFAKAPPLETPRKRLELGLPEELGEHRLDELCLIRDAERSSGGKPGDGAAAVLVVEDLVELFGEVGLAAAGRGRDG